MSDEAGAAADRGWVERELDRMTPQSQHRADTLAARLRVVLAQYVMAMVELSWSMADVKPEETLDELVSLVHAGAASEREAKHVARAHRDAEAETERLRAEVHRQLGRHLCYTSESSRDSFWRAVDAALAGGQADTPRPTLPLFDSGRADKEPTT